LNAIVIAAGEGTRLRPLTERWPKPVLPIDGRPVIGTLLRELAAGGIGDAVVVTGHLAEQVESLLGDGSAFGVRVRYARQPEPDGSADAVRRALAAGARLPAVVVAADTVFATGTFARFVDVWGDAVAAVAARRGRGTIDARFADLFGAGLTSAPLWGVGAELAPFLDGLSGPPYELADAVRRALDAGHEVRGVEIAGTRDLTDPLDLVEQNFPYLT
jgi:GTP:adenosylcobinamide-phosphate guanylyltransferase